MQKFLSTCHLQMGNGMISWKEVGFWIVRDDHSVEYPVYSYLDHSVEYPVYSYLDHSKSFITYTCVILSFDHWNEPEFQ
jgi:hypothetical protein